MHTRLINLAISLGRSTSSIQPVLLDYDFPIKSIGFRISLPRLGDHHVAPDTGFSSQKYNSILFIECKSGGLDDNGLPQTDRFKHVQDNPLTILNVDNNFNVKKDNVVIDFAILCSDIEKIKASVDMKRVEFPILHYDSENKVLKLAAFNDASFRTPIINDVFSTPIQIPREIFIHVPFSPDDYNNNPSYLIKNMVLVLLSENGKLDPTEDIPPLEELLCKKFPMLAFMDKREFKGIIGVLQRVIREAFPESDRDSPMNIRRFITFKNGKTYMDRTTLPKFIERMEQRALEIEGNKKAKKVYIPPLTEYDDNAKPDVTDEDRISPLFDGVDFKVD